MWIKRYTSFSLDELQSMTPEQFQLVCESLGDILSRENDPGGA